ncbi:MAG: TPM domain-containing protein [Streptococcaceae bacterium]|jgi:uncharacterized protein|nr:TPM domain-containing protein [Streptococcaceae bacterium]
MKKILFFVFLFLTVGTLNTSADGPEADIQDDASLFSETKQIQDDCSQLAKTIHANVYIITTDDSSVQDAEFEAKTLLKEKVGKEGDGIILYINMSLRKMYVWSTGNIHYYLGQSRIDSLLDDVQSNLSDGFYDEAALSFAHSVESNFHKGIDRKIGYTYTVDSSTGRVTAKRLFSLSAVISAFVLSLVSALSFLIFVVNRYNLPNSDYEYPFHENSSLKLTNAQDLLVNTFVTTRVIPRYSGGGSGGGGGGFGSGSGGGRSF